ncbi:alkaline phosphatase family protein [Burkholderia ubonensis]|uniref:Phosphoesterase n=1 Tax=Burkholderia ubonensis subsp. mesacidophila TaxID=265293 RepID=A0A2A4F1A4_9BURK|nr:alkaline phosphatase family protein [Burkholderia ubonensis]PCE26450.1 phosphoesterase [Burkholderia ubonensis subsp. mesacidophila]
MNLRIFITRALFVFAALLLAACSGNGPDASPSASALAGDRAGAPKPPKHIFIVALENEGYDTTFGPTSAAPYLARTLPAQGALLTQYYGIGHNSLDNYIAMVSGQAPNPQTQADCQFYTDWLGSTALDGNGQVAGLGCVLPPNVFTIGNQLQAAGLAWKGYMEDMGNDPARDGGTVCAHPALNAQDTTQKATATDNYAVRHDPFMYFHAVIDDPAGCGSHVVNLSQLDADLQSVSTTPSYAFITPNLCHDGHDSPCADGSAGGLASVDQFLQTLIPKIMNSPAYQQDGLIVITFDEAGTSDTSACCGETPGPNALLPGILGPGGGRTGAVLLSPSIRPGTVSNTPYNHYALLRSVEDLLGVPHLGFANANGLQTFGGDVFNATSD